MSSPAPGSRAVPAELVAGGATSSATRGAQPDPPLHHLAKRPGDRSILCTVVRRAGTITRATCVRPGSSSLIVLVTVAGALVATEDVHTRVAGRRRTGRVGDH